MVKQHIFFLTCLESGNSRSKKCCQGLFSRRPLWSSYSVFTWLFLCACVTTVSLPLLIGTPVLLDQGSALMTSFNRNYLLKGLISKYGYIENQFQKINLVGTISSITTRFQIFHVFPLFSSHISYCPCVSFPSTLANSSKLL